MEQRALARAMEKDSPGDHSSQASDGWVRLPSQKEREHSSEPSVPVTLI